MEWATAVSLLRRNSGTLADKFGYNWKWTPHPKNLDIKRCNSFEFCIFMVLTEIDPRESALRLKFRDLPLAAGLRISLTLGRL